MRNLNDTIARLAAFRARAGTQGSPPGGDHLTDLPHFGSNPGALRARCFIPETLSESAALVVVLHGCTQTAAGYDHGSGWSKVAREHGFALLFPEQQRANNPNLCFNWFNPEDIRRDAGEALSIRQMVAAMIAAHGLDPARIFITGLSAGGAMTSTMLATYPDVFAGGAIIAGLPFGTATSVPEAFDRMRGSGGPQGSALGAAVVAASAHQGPWPTISVWHGDADATVARANAALIVEQWRHVHDLPVAPETVESVNGHPRRAWRDATGREVIESYSIGGMGHGTPLSTTSDDACGMPAPYMLEAGISSTRRIAGFWGLVRIRQARRQEPARTAATAGADAQSQPSGATTASPQQSPGNGGVAQVIESALRAAGLMR
jgi:poly(hydroxyalkanoate) depolymerase family esterase